MAHLQCVQEGCKAKFQLPEKLRDLVRVVRLHPAEMYFEFGWSVTDTWHEFGGWDSMLWCPNHVIEADEWMADHEGT